MASQQSGSFPIVRANRASDRNDRRVRLIQTVQQSNLFVSDLDRANAQFVADAVVRRADGEFISRHASEAFPGHIFDTLNNVSVRQPDEILVGCSRPKKSSHGYDLPMFVLESCMADQAFIVDTIKLALKRMDVHVLGTLNMILPIERDADQRLVEISSDNPRQHAESFSCHLLSAASVGERAGEIKDRVRWHLQRAQRIANDFAPMRKLCRDIVSGLAFCAEDFAGQQSDYAEAVAFAEWLLDDHFVFMGAYGFDKQDRPTGRLGLGRYDTQDHLGVEGDPHSAFGQDAPLVSIHQSRLSSPVHRDAAMVEVRLRLVDSDGNADGGVVFQGLFTYKAVTGRASSVPFLRRRLANMVAAEDLVPASHRLKVFLSFFDRLPLTYTFSASDSEIVGLINDAIDVEAGGAPRVNYRVNAMGTGAQVFVILEQSRYGEVLRDGIEQTLARAFGTTVVHSSLLVGKTETVLVDYLLFSNERLNTPDTEVLADAVNALVSPWLETMRDMLRSEGVDEGEIDRLCLLYGEALPANQQNYLQARHLVEDLRALAAVVADGATRIFLRRDGRDEDNDQLRLVMLGPTDMALTDILPVLDHFGLRVLGETTAKIVDADGGIAFLETYRIAGSTDHGPHLLPHGDAFIQALHATLDGRMNSTSLNRLLLPARLSWRQLQTMRAYLGYARQLGTAFPANLVQQVLLNQPDLARTLTELFDARFAPRPGDASDVVSARHPQRLAQVAAVQAKIVEQLRTVQDAVEDKVLRMFANFINATLRTNFYQRPDDARGISFKFRCSDVELMPEPRPLFEIWVYDPRVEGIHLRGGKVARGGIRWSDRIDDFRTEVLGLMQTQMVKNTLIVPVGSKGGFVLKKPERDEQVRRKQADELYKVFINGLLDLTDNLLGGKSIPPADVVVYDQADPYLVVAADKGTAHLSDTANGLALSHGFWLGDAFASGGSKGYDHKLYGITAKGGWVCVQRHFREMGIDIQKDPFTVNGIGDMSGDVFGNGMLLSPVIRLQAAFDHRHIFLDPNPDAATSLLERQRLFHTPRSSWAMYDPALISQGGGVFSRTAKSIALTPEVQAMLGTERTEMSGPELMKAILLMHVDLFWNGGIGTFVKSSSETHSDVGDKTNDAIRVDATELRCKVVGEGGNLGFTHAARVEFALRGGRINTDAVDNSAGVDMSDHEVNLKILFTPLMQSGAVLQPERDEVLLSIDRYVSKLVTHNNDQQSLGISVAESRAAQQIRAWGDTVKFLVDEMNIDQEVQLLPSKQTLSDRRKLGLGLTRPELARITAFAKMWIYNELTADRNSSTAVDQHYLDYYFPIQIRAKYAHAIDNHMLRHEIVSTLWTNELVDFGSALLFPRLSMEFSRPLPELCQAHTLSVNLLNLPRLRAEIQAMNGQIAASAQYAAIAAMEEAAAGATRWLLASCPSDKLFEVMKRSEDLAAFSKTAAPLLMAGQAQARKNAAAHQALTWQSAGMPAMAAAEIAHLHAMSHLYAVWTLAQETGTSAADAVCVYFGTAEVTGFDELLYQIADATAQTRWEVAALASLGQGLGYTLSRLAVRVAQTLGNKAISPLAVRGVLVDDLRLGPLWDLAHQIQAEGVQIPALVVLTERLRVHLR